MAAISLQAACAVSSTRLVVCRSGDHSRQLSRPTSSSPVALPTPSNPFRLPAGGLVQPLGAVNNILELNELRRGVGLCIYRRDGLVFAARRLDDPQRSWQMPQGGIDPEEDPREAALRELYEETGIKRCRIVASIVRWLQYSFPTKVKAQLPGSFLRYRGQAQKWYLLEYVGDESEIDLACHGHPEFSEFAWMPLELLPAGVVEFKQEVYQQVARHFAPEIARRVAASASHVPRG
ncbi:hypothetical protein D9Q98_000192 [Chlorella vulgaris]|uniref:Nudix hydrolase domain-containing protein n=1 Tax=Chlorella vulgaris TaxID=3077 RepID=A0A9D4TYE4_CHLVU|nr:hypothetical protein D9Q98_000192 [Chlorella vulgaris]